MPHLELQDLTVKVFKHLCRRSHVKVLLEAHSED